MIAFETECISIPNYLKYYSTVIILRNHWKQYWRNKTQNNDLASVFYKLNVKTFKSVRQLQGQFYLHTINSRWGVSP